LSDIVKTNVGRAKRLNRIKGLDTSSPAIVQIAVGSGGRDDNGDVQAPTSDMTGLYNEVYRGDATIEAIDDYSCKLIIALDSGTETDLVGVDINELGTIDGDGTFITLETFALFDSETGFPENSQVNIKTQITVE